LGKRAQARQLLDDELFRLFGVAIDFSDDRPLSVLAGVMRHVLISGVRLQQPLMATKVPSLSSDEIGGNIDVAAAGNKTLLVLDAKLNHLARWIPEHVSLLEMRYFARLGLEDTARELEVATDVVNRELRFARASLARACGL
jgi:DNA-directed RNA polymerase specialized sigma24 family protein